MSLTYLLPLRSDSAPDQEFTDYLLWLSQRAPVVVVDSSPEPVFARAHQQWSRSLRHVRPATDLSCRNGKVSNVLSGLRLVTTELVIIADDDVRYDEKGLQEVTEALRDADVVRPQNWFDPAPWHALWDTARTLLNRATGGDFGGTLGVRVELLRATGGYDGDTLFENLELIRTIAAAGGRCVDRPDIYVRRLPPTSAHFRGQRVRQAYDEFARPWRLAAQLAIVPACVLMIGRRRAAATAIALPVLVAERGRRREHGRSYFSPIASLCAPVWLLERGVCSWLAVVQRFRGGVPYAGARLARAATPQRVLDRRYAQVRRNQLDASTGDIGIEPPARARRPRTSPSRTSCRSPTTLSPLATAASPTTILD